MDYAIFATSPGGVEKLVKREITPPSPGKGELMIRQAAIGLNFIDIYIRSGLYPWAVDGDLILGCEGAGVVEALGEGAQEFAVGDRVAYTIHNGAYATRRAVPVSHCAKVPDGISDEIAASSMLKGLTVYYLIHDSFHAKPGHTVLFHAAAGGVGQIAGQWLKANGITAIGTAGGEEKCKLASSCGFSHVIDYKSEDFVARVKEITDGKGVDAVYDSVGKDTVKSSLKCLKRHGILVNFGQSSGMVTDFKLSDLSAGSFYVTRPGLFHFVADPKWFAKATEALFRNIQEGKLTIPITRKMPLEQVADAHTALEGRQTTGCTLLIP